MPTERPTRRSFLKIASVAAASASCSVQAMHAAGPVHQGGTGKLKIGVVGMGGRGTGATVEALLANRENVLWAAGDAFADRIESSLREIGDLAAASQRTDQVDVPDSRRFVGLDAIDRVLASGIDVIVLASPPGFRPAQIEKAVAKGVHVFAEKPIATDAPGVRRVHAACELAKKKGLTVVSGLVYRYHEGRRQLVKRLHDGAVGEILAIQGNYVTRELWSFPRDPKWTELQWQLRNWLYYPWLSGDLIAEQHIHTLDMMAWIKRDTYPVSAVSLGGRQKRVEPIFGTVYDHFATIYEWADGTKGFSYCRQQDDCFENVNEHVLGTAGRANVFQHTITGENGWQLPKAESDKLQNAYQTEHDEMFAAIRSGKPINNGDYMCKSTLMALMGRMAAYTGKRITWDQAWNSFEVLMPEPMQWDDQPPTSKVAIPGITKFA